jgi:hypothetical protein
VALALATQKDVDRQVLLEVTEVLLEVTGLGEQAALDLLEGQVDQRALLISIHKITQ